MNTKYTEQEYRVDQWAVDAVLAQGIDNFFRRLLFLPIKKTSRQADEEVRQKYAIRA
jgi:hypothetical protein